MNSLMTLPIDLVERLEVEELLTVNGGGYIVFASPNNGSGTCSGSGACLPTLPPPPGPALG